jgi:GTP cyclohydrolase IA
MKDELLVKEEKGDREAMEDSQWESALERAARIVIEESGDDVSREGLERTPLRFAKAWRFLTSGYELSPAAAVGQGVFSSESDGLVCVKDIEFYSMCEHHMLPFWGKASVAYYPAKKILGLSKFPRLVDAFARRLQVQERLTKQVGEAVHHLVKPKAVAVRLEASHLCMMMRGVQKQKSFTISEYSKGLDKLSAEDRGRLWQSLN